LKKNTDLAATLNLAKGKIKITQVDGKRNRYLKKESKSTDIQFVSYYFVTIEKRNEWPYINTSRSKSPSAK